MNIVIVMPTHNEAMNIGRMIDVLAGQKFLELQPARMQLLVVDSNSSDDTANIVRRKIEAFPAVHLLSGNDRGLGNSYIKGFKYAMHRLHADAIIEMDADFQHDPEDLHAMVTAFTEGADYVIGSRYTPGSSIPSGWSWYRKTLSCFGNRFASHLLGIPHLHDLTTGFRLTRIQGVLNTIDLDNLMALERFAYKVDLLYKTVHISQNTIEIPIHFKERVREQSKFEFKELIVTFWVVVILCSKKVENRFKKRVTAKSIGNTNERKRKNN